MKLVVDSSVILKWLYQENEKYLEQADSLFKQVIEREIKLYAPVLAKYEIGNVLTVVKKLDEKLLKNSLDFFYSMPINFVEENLELAQQTALFSWKFQMTYYDASFVSLAKQKKATLNTDNPKHQGKVRGVKVIALEDYKK